MDDMIPRPMRQAQTIRDIATAVSESIPFNWDSARYTVTAVRGVLDFAMQVRAEGEDKSIASSDEADDLAQELRTMMYQPGAGTWFTFTLEVIASGEAYSYFDYDAEPVILLLDPEVYVDEQEKLPRDPANQPDWYRERLAEGMRLRAERDAAGQ